MFTPFSELNVAQMLEKIGVNTIDDLYRDIPKDLFADSFNLPEGLSEYEILSYFSSIAQKNNADMIQFAGAGFYDHFVPPAVDYIASRGEFYTAYTPYQPEASQGTLQALYEYQTAVCELTDMDVSNASLYDGGTAIIESILMAFRITRRSRVIIDQGINPLYRQMIDTAFSHRDFEIIYAPCDGIHPDFSSLETLLDENCAGLVVENPNFYGEVHDFSTIAQKVHSVGALLLMAVYPVSLGMLKTPGEMDADIVTAEGQSLGNYLNFGGPWLGIIACKQKYIRNLPGRIAGRTQDSEGKPAYVLTLQAREQHIRRQKATSNICSNQNLCALRSLVFLSLMGPDGMKKLAATNHSRACLIKKLLDDLPGVTVENTNFFNTLLLTLSKPSQRVYNNMLEKGILFGVPLESFFDSEEVKSRLLITVTEKRSEFEIQNAVQQLAEVLG